MALNRRIEIEANLTAIKAEIPPSVKLIVVTKTFPISDVKILKDLSIKKNQINKKEKELEETKKNILNKLNDKKILNNTISMCRENNKELLNKILTNSQKKELNNLEISSKQKDKVNKLIDNLKTFQVGLVGPEDKRNDVIDFLKSEKINYSICTEIEDGWEQETQDKILGALVLVASATIAVGAKRKDLPPYEEICEDFIQMLQLNVREMVKGSLSGIYDH